MQSNPLAQSNPFTQNPIQSSRKCPKSKTPLMVFFLQFLDFIENLPIAFAGVCTVRSLRNISNVEATIKEPVVANNATASTVAFIAPGPPNPPITQVSVSFLFISWVYFLHLPSSISFLPTRAISCRAPPPPLLAAPFTSPPLSSTAGQLSIERQPIRPVRAHPTPTSGRDPDLWSPCT